MTDDAAQPHTLFGVSRGFDPGELDALQRFLWSAWSAQYRRPPSTLSADLDALAELFRKDAPAKTVRAAASKLRPIDAPRPLMAESLFLAIDERHGFVTPEGRVLFDELRRLRHHSEYVLSRDRMLAAALAVADFYGSSSRRWMAKELHGGDLRPSTFGVVVFLLINGSIGRERALALPPNAQQEGQLAQHVIPVVDAFAMSIGGKPLPKREAARLRGNWAVTESSRQLLGLVERAETADSTLELWIVDGKQERLIERLGAGLARRRGVTLPMLRESFDAAREAYSEARPALVSWGLCHERPQHSAAVVEQMVDSFSRAAAAL